MPDDVQGPSGSDRATAAGGPGARAAALASDAPGAASGAALGAAPGSGPGVAPGGGAPPAGGGAAGGSMRGFWLGSPAWVVPVFAVLAALAIYGMLERGFGLPELTASQACGDGSLTFALPALAGGETASLVIRLPGAATATAPFPACNPALTRLVAAGATLPGGARAAVLVGLSFTAGLLIAAVLAFYALMTVARHGGGRPWVVGSVVFGAALASVLVYVVGWLPHAATDGVLALLEQAGTVDGRASASTARFVARAGSFIVVLVLTWYVVALAWLATPIVPGDAPPTAAMVDTLSRAFERLTTLSYVGSLAFAFAVLTLTALLQWPQAIPGLGPAVGHAGTAITALFGAYLTAVLTGAFLPAATRLEYQAEQAARLATEVPGTDTLAARRKWLADRGLTVFSTTRIGAALATLLPLLAGAVSGLSGAATTLAGALR